MLLLPGSVTVVVLLMDSVIVLTPDGPVRVTVVSLKPPEIEKGGIV